MNWGICGTNGWEIHTLGSWEICPSFNLSLPIMYRIESKHSKCQPTFNELYPTFPITKPSLQPCFHAFLFPSQWRLEQAEILLEVAAESAPLCEGCFQNHTVSSKVPHHIINNQISN